MGGVQQIVSGATSSYGVALNDRVHTVGVANQPVANSFDTIPTVFRFVPSTNETTYPLAYARPGGINLPGYVACIVDHPGSADDGKLIILDPNDKLIHPVIPSYLSHEMPSGFASNKLRICGTAYYNPIGGRAQAITKPSSTTSSASSGHFLIPRNSSSQPMRMRSTFGEN